MAITACKLLWWIIHGVGTAMGAATAFTLIIVANHVGLSLLLGSRVSQHIVPWLSLGCAVMSTLGLVWLFRRVRAATRRREPVVQRAVRRAFRDPKGEWSTPLPILGVSFVTGIALALAWFFHVF